MIITNVLRKYLEGAAALLLLLGFLPGCTTPAKSGNMVASEYRATRPHSASVGVAIGAQDYNKKAAMAQISDGEFRTALLASLRNSGVFQSVVDGGDGDYLLYANVSSIQQPVFGVSMTTNLAVYWKLMRSSNQRTAWQKTISSTYTAEFGEHLIGADRARKSTEGALRKNIETALRELAQLGL